ncbi:MAG: hypothetical protein AAFN93_04050 [Bacteroidota bacterium]
MDRRTNELPLFNMNPKALFTLLLLLICFSSDLFGQRYLLLRKTGRRYKIVFNEGEEMRFKLKGERFFNKGLIQGFGDDHIRFHYFTIKLDEIAEIDVSRKNFTAFNYSGAGATVVVGSVGYLAIDQFNQTVIRDEPFRVNERTAIISGSLATAGFLMRFLQKKRFKMKNKKHVMQITDLSP